MADPTNSVAEMQGLYGPFTLSERVLQRIWLHQDFSTHGARVTDGRAVAIEFPGKWNLLGGPDFLGARLRIGGELVEGDVEVHFHAADWHAHGHGADPSYRRVVLHVLLFPPSGSERIARDGDGRPLPALVLLPLLRHDLEEYAANDALEAMTARDEWRRIAQLATKPVEEVRDALRNLGEARWKRKVRYAQARIEKLGWEEAAHHTALEILGYRQNRVPMLAVAERWPLRSWRAGVSVEEVWSEASQSGWRIQGVRPANRPQFRLAQYRDWVKARPDWPQRLIEAMAAWPVPNGRVGTKEFRRRANLTRLSAGLADALAAGVLGGPRWDTFVCDGLLPLAAARADRDFGELWFNWFSGDLPDQIRRGLRQLCVVGAGGAVHCHGYSQGLLGWFLENEVSS